MRGLKKGFTLAEVLITLLIIGVIASIVIPGLINNTNEAEYNASLKKIYADLSNAIKIIQANNGGSVSVGEATYAFSWGPLRDEFCNVMTCVKKDTENNVFEGKIYKYYKSSTNISTNTLNNTANNGAVLNNGTSLSFYSNGNCNGMNVNMCGSIYVDINGPKGPNMYGKDLYFFWIKRLNGTGVFSIIPVGTQGASSFTLPNGCQSNSTDWSTSEGCTAWRLTSPDNMP